MTDWLESGRYCRWSAIDGLAEKAKALRARTVDATIAAIYEFVTLGVAYDDEKAGRLRGGRGYVPDPEETFESGKGVCFDKAALMTAMLRADGIPAKLCVGDMDGESHAWVTVWDGRHWLRCDPTVTTGRQKSRKYVTKYQL